VFLTFLTLVFARIVCTSRA